MNIEQILTGFSRLSHKVKNYNFRTDLEYNPFVITERMIGFTNRVGTPIQVEMYVEGQVVRKGKSLVVSLEVAQLCFEEGDCDDLELKYKLMLQEEVEQLLNKR